MSVDNRNCFLVNLRDGLRCRNCGVGPGHKATYHSGFGYHHVRHKAHGGPDVADNLVLLCKTCHDAYHDDGRPLAVDFVPLPATIPCHACGDTVHPRTVPMNCGWYHCPRCDTRVHLFDHFGFVETDEA